MLTSNFPITYFLVTSHIFFIKKKIHVQETQNLLTGIDNITDTKKEHCKNLNVGQFRVYQGSKLNASTKKMLSGCIQV